MLSSLFNFIIPTAYAASGAAPAQQPGGMWETTIMMVGIVGIFYFLLWRPQAKRAKEHRELVSNLGKGDEVVNNGGIAGKITKVGDDFLVVEIAKDVEVRMQKGSVSTVLPKGTLKAV